MPATHQAYALLAGSNGNATFSGEFGLTSTVGSSAIQVSALGAFRDAAAGSWSSSKVITLWNATTQAVLARITIFPTDGSDVAPLVGQYAIKQLGSPVAVPAGTLLTVSVDGYFTDKFSLPRTGGPAPTTDDGGGLLTFTGTGVTNGTPGAFPSSPGTESAAGYGGPTLVYALPGGGVPIAVLKRGRRRKMSEKRAVGSTLMPIYVDAYLTGTNTPATGLVSGSTMTLVLSKNQGATAAPAGAISELLPGRYGVSGAGLAADLNTYGTATVIISGGTIDTNKNDFLVVPGSPFN